MSEAVLGDSIVVAGSFCFGVRGGLAGVAGTADSSSSIEEAGSMNISQRLSLNASSSALDFSSKDIVSITRSCLLKLNVLRSCEDLDSAAIVVQTGDLQTVQGKMQKMCTSRSAGCVRRARRDLCDPQKRVGGEDFERFEVQAFWPEMGREVLAENVERRLSLFLRDLRVRLICENV
jgi:hypothetical protein